MPGWDAVRVFVSSTFRDMRSEREALAKDVFPEIRARLARHGLHLEDIDLRWGIAPDTALSEEIVSSCLDEVERCPFFIGLLGERYGWVPSSGSGRSITELEILKGLEKGTQPPRRALIYLRDPSFLANLPQRLSREFVDDSSRDGPREKLEALKQRIRHDLEDAGCTEEYPCHYAGVRVQRRLVRRLLDADEAATVLRLAPQGLVEPEAWEQLGEDLQERLLEVGSIHLASLETFAERLREDLWTAMLTELRLEDVAGSAVDGETVEAADHEGFLESRRRVYFGRGEVYEQLRSFAEEDDSRPCLVLGPAGIGKSSVLAHFVGRYREQQPEALVAPHFLGASAEACRLGNLLGRFCRQLKDRFNFPDPVPTETAALSARFIDLVARIPRGTRVVFVVDGFNHLDPRDDPYLLSWLPRELPGHVKVMVSSLRDGGGERILAAFEERPHTPLSLEPLSDADRSGILRHVPSLFAKTFSADQQALLLGKESSRNPLFLLVALEELRLFGSFERLSTRIAELPEGDGAVAAIFEQVCERLEEDFDSATVRDTLALIGASRDGLSESELRDPNLLALSADQERSLSALLHQLRPYLLIRGPLVDFFHAQLSQVVRARYLGGPEAVEAHLRLARFFYRRARRDRRFSGDDARALGELTHHLRRAGKIGPFRDLLVDFDFLAAKLEALGPGALIDDFDLLLEAASAETGIDTGTLAAIRGALRRSAHILAEDPAQVGAQLWRVLGGVTSDGVRRFLAGTRHEGPWLRPGTRVGGEGTGLLRQTLVGHRGPVTALVTSRRDPGWAVSGSADGTLKIWDLESGAVLRTLVGHRAPITDLALAEPAGAIVLVSASADESVKVWDVDAQAERLTLQAHFGPVTAVAVSPDGRRVISTSNDERMMVWDAETGEELCHSEQEEIGEYAIGTAVATTPDGWRAAIGSADHYVVVWDTERGEKLAKLESHAGDVTDLLVTSDGRRLVSSSADGCLKIWNLEDGSLERTLEGHYGSVTAIALVPGSGHVVSASLDGSFREWDLERGESIRARSAPLGGTTRLAATADGRYLVTSAEDHSLKIWDLDVEAAGKRLSPTPPLKKIAVAKDGSLGVSLSRGGILQVWDLVTGEQRTAIRGTFRTFVLTPGGELLAASRRALQWWNPVSGERLRSIEGRSGWIHGLTLTPDGRRVFAPGEDGFVEVRDVATGELNCVLRGHEKTVAAAAAAEDGARVISASFDTTLEVWDLAAGQSLGVLEGHESYVVAVAISRDGRIAASASDDQTVRVWDLELGRERHAFVAHQNLTGIEVLALSADGRRVVHAAEGDVLEVRDTASGELVHRLAGHLAEIAGVALDAGGRWLASASLDATLAVWDLETGARLARFSGDAGFTGCVLRRDLGMLFAGDEAGRAHVFRLEDGAVRPRPVYLEVPFAAKGEAKQRGAGWDPQRKRWYAPSELELAPFRPWLPASQAPRRGTAPGPPIWLQVPYEEKDQAKACGARWDRDAQRWWAPAEADPAKLRRWLEADLTASIPCQKLLAPVYLLESIRKCHSCGHPTRVVTLAASGVAYAESREDEKWHFGTLSNIVHLPVRLAWHIEDRFPGYFEDHSIQGGGYVMNHCSCGARQGDFFLNEYPGAFVPAREEDCEDMALKPLPGLDRLGIDADYGFPWPPLIARAAHRHGCVSMAGRERPVEREAESLSLDDFPDGEWTTEAFHRARLAIERGHRYDASALGLLLERADRVLRETRESVAADAALRGAALRVFDAMTRTGPKTLRNAVRHLFATLTSNGYLGWLDVRQADVSKLWRRTRRREDALRESPHRRWFEHLLAALERDPGLVVQIEALAGHGEAGAPAAVWRRLMDDHGADAVGDLAVLGFRAPEDLGFQTEPWTSEPELPAAAEEDFTAARGFMSEALYAEAEPRLRRALTIAREALGEQHYDVALFLNELGLAILEQERHADAEPFFRRALETLELCSKEDDSFEAKFLSNLGSACRYQDRPQEAESCFQRALTLQENHSGPEHRDVAVVLINLQGLYIDEDRNAEAEPLVRRTLSILEKARGPVHEDVAGVLDTLATVLYREGALRGSGAIRATGARHPSPVPGCGPSRGPRDPGIGPRDLRGPGPFRNRGGDPPAGAWRRPTASSSRCRGPVRNAASGATRASCGARRRAERTLPA